MPISKNLLSLTAVADKTGLTAEAIRQRAAAGTFPSPLPLCPWHFAWAEDAVAAWQEENAPSGNPGVSAGGTNRV
jgi:predicted DNA-binding transcriptional regulator AlpA